MALLEVLKFPDPRLRVIAKPVITIDQEIREIVANMYETMYEQKGIGLAATQVGIDKRIFVMDLSETLDQPYCLINPEIISAEGEQEDQEGCLSVGGNTFDWVTRAMRVRVKALDIEGTSFELEGEALMAACIQHEIDHLNGILFIDHLSKLKRERIRKKIEKLNRR